MLQKLHEIVNCTDLFTGILRKELIDFFVLIIEKRNTKFHPSCLGLVGNTEFIHRG